MDWKKMNANQKVALIQEHCTRGYSAGQIVDTLSSLGMVGHTRGAVIGHILRHMREWWEGRGKDNKSVAERMRLSSADAIRRVKARKASPGVKDAPVENCAGIHLDLMLRPELRLECRFPLWRHNEEPTMMFCGEPATRGSYCERHAAICFDKVALKPVLTTKERKAA